MSILTNNLSLFDNYRSKRCTASFRCSFLTKFDGTSHKFLFFIFWSNVGRHPSFAWQREEWRGRRVLEESGSSLGFGTIWRSWRSRRSAVAVYLAKHVRDLVGFTFSKTFDGISSSIPVAFFNTQGRWLPQGEINTRATIKLFIQQKE